MRGPGRQAHRSRGPRPDRLVERDGAGRDVGVHALDHAALKRDHAAALVLRAREGGDDRPAPPEPDFMSEGIFLPFAPLPGTAHHPLNPDDAELLQEQLRVAGYYQSSPDGIWGMNSRNALRQFKAANGLPTDDIWDVATERALMGRLGSEGRLRHVPRSR
jgi:hypothetical protein